MLLSELREQVFRLPISDRLNLVKDIIDSIQEKPNFSPAEKNAAFLRLRGVAKTDEPSPTDQEIEAMLEERRLEKFLK